MKLLQLCLLNIILKYISLLYKLDCFVTMTSMFDNCEVIKDVFSQLLDLTVEFFQSLLVDLHLYKL